MKFPRSLVILISAITPAFAGSIVPVIAETTGGAPSESAWKVRAALYGWGVGLDGDITLSANNVPLEAGFDDVLDNLDYAVMGTVEIGKGEWSFLADLFLAELSVGNSRGNLDFDVGLEQFIGNFTINRIMVDEGCNRFDLFAGARVNSVDLDLDITRAGIIRTRTFSGSERRTWVDPIIGARYQRELSDRFFLRFMGDIGGFDVSSDFTWQALAGLGCQINNAASVVLGYRGVGSDYAYGGFGYDVISHGLLLGLECRF
jgi:opacity protein-like surface antigen